MVYTHPDIHRSFAPLRPVSCIHRIASRLIYQMIKVLHRVITSLSLFLHILHQLVDTRLLLVYCPQLQDPFIPLFVGLVSKVLGCLSRIVALKRVAKEVESLKHHYICGLLVDGQLLGHSTEYAIVVFPKAAIISNTMLQALVIK